MLDPSMYFIDQPLYHMTVDTSGEALTKRAAVAQSIWGSAFPNTLGYTNIAPGVGDDGNMSTAYFGRAPTNKKWLGLLMDTNVWARMYFAQFGSTNTLVIVNGGHGQGFFNVANLPDFNVPGVDALVRRLAAAGCDIVLSSMPMMGENRFAAPYYGFLNNGVSIHDQMGNMTPSHGSPLRYFLEPALVGVNYATSLRSYSKIVMLGLSGGGWTTTALAALDPRITHAYAVAGSVPLAYRMHLPMEGDWEQYALPADYLDFYAMSVAESGRRSFLMYNGRDECCFQNCAVQPWGKPLVEKLSSFPGTFGINMRYAQVEHDISDKQADFIMSDIFPA